MEREEARWHVSTSQGKFTANFVVSAVGPLTEPALPDIDGLDEFEGEIFHSARWNHDYDLTGKRVAVIGTGASAIQIIPELAKTVRQLHVYQRTAPWVLPRFDRNYTTAERLAFAHVPGYQRAIRSAIYWSKELIGFALTHAPKMLVPVQKPAKRHIERAITDPQLRAKVTPRWQIGCKRILMSNTYYPALAQPHVDVVTDGIAAVRPNAIVTTDGSVREVDAIVVATGFHVTDSPTNECIIGRGGHSLADTWQRAGAQAYKGSTVHGFPNLFVMTGPGTGSGHTSAVFMIESQLNYLRDLIRTTTTRGIATVEVRKDAQNAYNDKYPTRFAKLGVGNRRMLELVPRQVRQDHHHVARLHVPLPPADPHIRPQRLPRGARPRAARRHREIRGLRMTSSGRRVRYMPRGRDRFCR